MICLGVMHTHHTSTSPFDSVKMWLHRADDKSAQTPSAPEMIPEIVKLRRSRICDNACEHAAPPNLIMANFLIDSSEFGDVLKCF